MLSASTTMTGDRTHASPRTCAGCKASAQRGELVRFALSDEPPFVAPDLGAKLQGRGVSVHPTRACLRAAVVGGGFAKAARKPVKLSFEALARSLSERYAERATSLLGAARRNGALTLGTDATIEAIDGGRAKLVVLALDAAGRREDVRRAATAHGVEVLDHANKLALGALFGRGDVGVVGVVDATLAGEISRAIARSIALSEAE